MSQYGKINWKDLFEIVKATAKRNYETEDI